MTKKEKNVEITKQAKKQLEALNQQDQDNIIAALYKYAKGDRVNIKKLKTSENDKRIKVGHYRAIIEEADKIYVLSIVDRKNAYRRL